MSEPPSSEPRPGASTAGTSVGDQLSWLSERCSHNTWELLMLHFSERGGWELLLFGPHRTWVKAQNPDVGVALEQAIARVRERDEKDRGDG